MDEEKFRITEKKEEELRTNLNTLIIKFMRDCQAIAPYEIAVSALQSILLNVFSRSLIFMAKVIPMNKEQFKTFTTETAKILSINMLERYNIIERDDARRAMIDIIKKIDFWKED